MAIEIPNCIHACGVFDGFDPPALGEAILTSNGIQPVNPATTPADPVGGFTRIATGIYLIGLVQAIDFREGLVHVTPLPGKFAHMSAQINFPAGDDSTDGTVPVTALDNDALAVDTVFQLTVIQFKTGTEGAFPDPVV